MNEVDEKKNQADLSKSFVWKRVDQEFESDESVWKISKRETKEFKILYI